MSTAEVETPSAESQHEADPVAEQVAAREAELEAEGEAVLSLGPGGMKLEDPGDDPDEHDIIRAETDGMVAVDPPKPSTKEEIEAAEYAEAIEKATEEVCHYQERAEVKKSQAVRLKEEASDAKKASEAADDDLREAARRLRKLREGQFPDADRYPLLDRKEDATDSDKARVDGMFPKPEAIQPGMPSTLEDLQAIRARDTTLESLKFGKQIMAKFAKAGVTTVHEFGEKGIEAFGFTEGQGENVRDAMYAFWQGVAQVWNEAHPDEAQVAVTAAGLDEANPEEAGGGGTAIGEDGPGEEEISESDRMHREAFDAANPAPDEEQEV